MFEDKKDRSLTWIQGRKKKNEEYHPDVQFDRGFTCKCQEHQFHFHFFVTCMNILSEM